MSSHHIVREKQEPALLILNLDHFGVEHLGQLLEWSPTVFVSEKVYPTVEALGIKIDGVLASSAEGNWQANTQVILSGEDYLQSGIHYFLEKTYPPINVIDDSFSADRYLHYCSRIDLVIFAGNKKIFPIKSGFSKWTIAGEKIEVSQHIDELRFTNLRSLGPGKFTVITDGFYTLSFNDPFIFVAEEF